jgi:hypothetical protein
MARNIYGIRVKRAETADVSGRYRTFHKKELYNLSSTNTAGVVNS